MTPQEQAPAAALEAEFQRLCEEAALSVLCDHRDAWIETQERKEERNV